MSINQNNDGDEEWIDQISELKMHITQLNKENYIKSSEEIKQIHESIKEGIINDKILNDKLDILTNKLSQLESMKNKY